ncbi:MAG: SusC/RagA family TonB-linked outer membrane protein [Chitinophagaceae bacterium]
MRQNNIKKYKPILVCFSTFLLGSVVSLSAQNVRGHIVNGKNGVPLEGATVRNLSKKLQAESKSDGTFQLRAEKGDRILFALIGFRDTTILYDGISELLIHLNDSIKKMDEVVVTALGLKRRTKGLSYSTQTVSADAVSGIKDNSGNFVSTLTGKIAGAVVTTASGGPGSSSRIVLRGNKSISGNNIALIVVDGVVYDNTSVTQSMAPNSNIYSSSDGGANINPEQIESINILKGPSAAALYGSRAVNGAIIITTKQGTFSSFRMDFNSANSIETATYLPNFQNSYGRGNGGVTATDVGDSWGAAGVTYPDNVKHFFNTGYSNSNSVSGYGGTEKINSYFSYTNNKTEGVVPGNTLKQNNLDLRVSTQFVKGLKTDLKLSYVNQGIFNKPRMTLSGLMNELYTMPRDMSDEELSIYETYDSSTGLPQSYYWNSTVNNDNPYWTVNRTSVNEHRNRISGIGSISYQFLPWLNFMTRVSFDYYSEKTDASFYNSTMALGNVAAGGEYYETQSQYSNHNWDFLLTSTKNVADHNIQLNYVLGSSLLTRNFETYTNMANGLTIPNKFSIAFATTPTYSGVSGYKRQLNSMYGSLNVGFWDNVFIDVTGRNDWSSTLPSPHSYFYPSVGLAFIFNEWLHLPSWINMAKARASYTKVGNDADPYLLNQTYSYSSAAGSGFITRSTTKSIANLKPEQTTSFETGLDLQMFDNRLTINGTYYHSNSINQLMYLSLPIASGYSYQYINAGKIENKGIELQLQVTPVKTANFLWNTSLNYARNMNKVIKLSDQVTSANISDNTNYATPVVKAGGSYGDLYGYKWTEDATTGKYIVNSSGLPVVESSGKLGNANPAANMGWTNTFSYKEFSLNVNIDGRIDGQMVSGTAGMLADYGVADFTTKYRDGGWVLDAVDQSGNQNTTAINAETFWTTVGNGGSYAYGQFFTYDMTNFRIRNIALSYNYPNKLFRFVKNAQFTLSSNNVLFLYKGKSVLDIPGLGKIKNPVDPEGAIGSSNFQGIESSILPTTRTITLTIKLSL